MGNCMDKRRRNQQIFVYPKLRASLQNDVKKQPNFSCGTSVHPRHSDTETKNLTPQKHGVTSSSESDHSNLNMPSEVVVKKSKDVNGSQMVKCNGTIYETRAAAGNFSDDFGFAYATPMYGPSIPVYYQQSMQMPMAANMPPPMYYPPCNRPICRRNFFCC